MSSAISGRVFVGGTFDHLHVGHEELLKRAVSLRLPLRIGVTTDAFAHQLEKKWLSALEPYETRVQNVLAKVKELRKEFQVEQDERDLFADTLVSLHDRVGALSEASDRDILVLSEETKENMLAWLGDRQMRGSLVPQLSVVPFRRDKSGEIISSSRIRLGIINQRGSIYYRFISSTFSITEEQKVAIRNLPASVYTEPFPGDIPPAVVGDISLSAFLKNNWPFSLGFFDGKSRRQVLQESTSSLLTQNKALHRVRQSPGSLDASVSELLQMIQVRTAEGGKLPSQELVWVEGEEDLCAITAVLLLPLGLKVVFGMVDEGMKYLEITAELKEHIVTILGGWK